MNLNILLPNKVFAKHNNVLRVVVETLEGAFGFLPNRRDCTAALAPGILTFETTLVKARFVAIDQGILVKKDQDISISVRRAIEGVDLSQLHAAVELEFLTLTEKQQQIQHAIDKLESGFLQQLSEFTTSTG